MKTLPSVCVAVLGAGLTGVATALELARSGVRVALLEQDELAMNRASLRNEGKIHLGLIYANDTSLRTARLQLEGALQFRALLARWIGARADELRQSAPFTYVVAQDSVLGIEKLEQHYAEVERLYLELLGHHDEYDYLGTRVERLYERCRLADIEAHFRTHALAGAFRTAELAIDTQDLARALRGAICDDAHIEFLPRRKVMAVTRRSAAHRIEGIGPEGAWRLDAGQVVNALWDNRLKIDAEFGLTAEKGWLHRLKYRVIARLPDRFGGAPSATMVLGRYGDVVMRRDATAYLSWYPAGLQGWSHELSPPDSWAPACRGELSREQRGAVFGSTVAALDAWYPGIGDARPLIVDAGVIVAYGRTDVDDAASGLHERSRIGVTSIDGYHSVDPGKLTTAPLFAKHAAERVLGLEVAA